MADIPDLSSHEWEELTERLTLYASCKLVRRYWRGLRVKKGDGVTKGYEAQDFAADAIVAVIEGKRASWNKEAYPDFFSFLQSIIDSKISALVRSPENRKTRRILDPESGGAPLVPFTFKSDELSPDQLVEDSEWKEKFRTALIKELGEDAISLGLFDCLNAEISDRQQIAEILDVPVNDIYNAQKRLERRVETVMWN